MSRRLRAKDPVFGFDSFVDLITNLLGIVIRLMLVIMVGAYLREHLPRPAAETGEQAVQNTLAAEQELEGAEQEVAALERRLLESARAIDLTRASQESLRQRQAAAQERRAQAKQRLAEGEEQIARERQAALNDEKGLVPLRDRLAELHKSIKELEEQPPLRRTLRYHLPVSRPVASEELIFECCQGRVTFADLHALLEQARKSLPEKGQELRTRWSVDGATEAAGPFRLHYTIARDRDSSLDQAFGALPPADDRRFRYGMAKWELEPVWPVRGETASEALSNGARFRDLIDALDPEQVVLTFFVYPDSFDVFRTLRDVLYDRGFVVAGRPLPPEQPIQGSRHGSLSRGQ